MNSLIPHMFLDPHTGVQSSLTALDCDGRHPCSTCQTVALRCVYPRPTTPPSAWTAVDPADIQRWPESLQLTSGQAAAFRLRAERDERGKVEAFGREWMVEQEQDLRLQPRRGRTSLLFPASADDRGESETLDLVGDPLDLSREGQILHNFHEILAHNPLQPTVALNATLQARSSTAAKQTRVLRTFEPRDPNIGNVLSACEVPFEGAASTSTCVAFRRAPTPGGRATAVGWGTFSPLPRELRILGRKGKEREAVGDAPSSSAFRPAANVLFTSEHPVRQVELSALDCSPTALLGVRTQNSLDLVHLSVPSDPGTESASSPSTLSRFTYTAASLARSPIADFALSGTPGAGLIVDTNGTLFGWGLGARGSGRIGARDWRGGQPEMFRLRRGRKVGQIGYNGMARVQYGGMRPTDAVVAVEDEVMLYDLRSPRDSVTLVEPHLLSQHLPFGESGPARIVSLMRRSPASLGASTTTPHHVFATTQDIIYVDERMPSRDLLRWRHGRTGLEAKGADLTLSLLEVPAHPDAHLSTEAGVARVALMSRLHPQIEFFTTRREPDQAPRFALDPYTVPGPPRISDSVHSGHFVRAGTAFVPLPPSSVAASAVADAMDVDGLTSSDESDGAPVSHRERRVGTVRKSQQRAWHLLEAGTRGDLRVRELELARFAGSENDEDADVQAYHGAAQTGTMDEVSKLGEQANRILRRRSSWEGRKKHGRLINVSEVRRALAPGKVLCATAVDNGADDAGVPHVAETLLRNAVQAEGGDVGALTAFEVLSLAHKHTRTFGDDREPAIQPLPRPTLYEACGPVSADNTAPLAAVVAAGSTALHLTSAEPATYFTALLPRSPAPVATAATASPAERLHASAAARWSREVELASHVILTRHVEPDEPVRAPNRPQPVDEEPPALHFSYLRPKVPTTAPFDASASGTPEFPVRTTPPMGQKGPNQKNLRTGRPKRDTPSLDSLGARLLLAEWHIGADPRSYTWHNPYEDDQEKDLDALAVARSKASSSSRRRKREREFEASFSSSARSAGWQPTFPPSSSTDGLSQHSYFPSLVPSQFPPAIGSTQSQAGPDFAATQPTISVTGPADPSSMSQGLPAFGEAMSQTVPGAFGSRLTVGGGRLGGERDKKKAKKRVSGF